MSAIPRTEALRGATSLPGFVGASLRRLRFERTALAATLVVVAATSFLFAALPRAFGRLANQGLRSTLEQANPLQRDFSLTTFGRIPAAAGAAPLASVAAAAGRQRRGLPAALRDVVASGSFAVASPGYGIVGGVPAIPNVQRYLSVETLGDVRSHVRLARGRWPAPSSERVRVATPTIPGTLPRRVPLLEVALPEATARRLRLGVGDRLVLVPGGYRVTAETLSVPVVEQRQLALAVVGLYRVPHPDETFWAGDASLARPEVFTSQDLTTTWLVGAALVLPSQYRDLLAATGPLPLSYADRFLVQPERVDASRLGPLDDAVRSLNVRYANPAALAPQLQLQLGSLLDEYRSARTQAETLLAIAAIGLLACALADVGLLAALSIERRRSATALTRSRGASPLHVLAAQAGEGLALAVPAGALGWAIARFGVAGPDTALSLWLVAAIVAGTVLLYVGAIASLARRPVGPSERGEVVVQRLSPRRLALEGLVVVLAGLGVYLLRRRGLASAGERFDPYLAAVPVLLGLAGGIVALRLYPLPVRALAALARRRRGLALPLGLARSARETSLASAPLLVLLLAVAVAVFSAAMLTTLERAQARTAWRQVGADVRVDAPADGALSASLARRIEQRTGARVAAAVVVPVGDPGPSQALLVALDLKAYARVVRGTPAAFRPQDELLRPPPIAIGIPVAISEGWPAGSSFSIPTEGGNPVSFLGVARRGGLPGVPTGTPFALADLSVYEQAVQKASRFAVPPTRLYVRGGSLGEIRKLVETAAPSATIATRAAAEKALRAPPLVSSAVRGFRAAIIVAGLYAALATLLMVLVSARNRARDLAYLRTLGASQRQGLALAAVELGPLAAAAVLLGVGLGIAIPSLLAPGLRLGFFTGGSARPPLALAWGVPLAVAGGLLALVAALVLAVGLGVRRADLSRVLRFGER